MHSRSQARVFLCKSQTRISLARKPESYFRSRVRKALDKRVYIWPISDGYTSGVPDHWYSGNGADLWAEYKYYPEERKTFCLQNGSKITRLQEHWLNSRLDEGRNVCVIVGFPSGGIILQNRAWMETVIVNNLLSIKEIAEWIESQTLL